MRSNSRLWIQAFALTLLGMVAVSSASWAAPETAFRTTFITTVMRLEGSYQFDCVADQSWPGLAKYMQQAPSLTSTYSSGFIASPVGCPGSAVYLNASFPAGAPPTPTYITGVYGSGKMHGPHFAATSPDSLVDSIAVNVTRAPTSVTLGIAAAAKHYNPNAAPNNDAVSRLYIAIYPDTVSADARTGAIASGEMLFIGSGKVLTNGFLSGGDFTSITALPGTGFRIGTIAGLSKVVTVPNGNTAVVQWSASPTSLKATPGASPALLALLAALLLGGATLLLMKRGTATA